MIRKFLFSKNYNTAKKIQFIASIERLIKHLID